MTRVSIDKNLAESLLNYLATKPYSEVWQLIGTLQHDIKPVPETGQTQPEESEASKP